MGKLMAITDQKWDEVAGSVAIGLKEEKLGNSTKKGRNQFLHKVLLMCNQRTFTNGWKDSKEDICCCPVGHPVNVIFVKVE